MNEKQYEIISEYRNLKESSFFPFRSDPNDSKSVGLKKDEIRARFKELERELEVLSKEKSIVENYKNNVLSAIKILLNLINRSKIGSPLDRNQGLNIDNFIYGKVVGVIKDSIKDGSQVSYPDFYHRPGGDFDETKLRKILIELENELGSEFKSYFELEDCVDKYLNKINMLWKLENEELIKY